MAHTHIVFNESDVPVKLIGTDQKLIPSLLSALRNNRLTLSNLSEPPVQIELFSSEAVLYSSEGDKYRIPIF